MTTRLTQNDLLFGFEKLGIEADGNDAKLVTSRYDADEDGKLGFWEFSNMLMPVDPMIRDELERKASGLDLTPETRQEIQHLIRKVIDAESMVEAIRQNIEKNVPLSLREVFDHLDWLKRGFLTSSEFRRYFDGYPGETESLKKGAETHADILEGLLRRFNKDKLNGRVSLPEFLDELTSKCPTKNF